MSCLKTLFDLEKGFNLFDQLLCGWVYSPWWELAVWRIPPSFLLPFSGGCSFPVLWNLKGGRLLWGPTEISCLVYMCVCMFAAMCTPLCSHASVCLLGFGDVRVSKRVPRHVLLCRWDSPPLTSIVMSRGAWSFFFLEPGTCKGLERSYLIECHLLTEVTP